MIDVSNTIYVEMQPSAAGWCHFDHLYQRSRLHAVIPGKWSLSKKLVI